MDSSGEVGGGRGREMDIVVEMEMEMVSSMSMRLFMSSNFLVPFLRTNLSDSCLLVVETPVPSCTKVQRVSPGLL